MIDFKRLKRYGLIINALRTGNSMSEVDTDVSDVARLMSRIALENYTDTAQYEELKTKLASIELKVQRELCQLYFVEHTPLPDALEKLHIDLTLISV